jgi:hypothetical protein
MIYNALTTHRKLNVDHKLLLKCEAFTVLKTDELYLLVLNPCADRYYRHCFYRFWSYLAKTGITNIPLTDFTPVSPLTKHGKLYFFTCETHLSVIPVCAR